MEGFTRLAPVFLFSTIVMISSRCAVRLVDGDLWLKLLPVPGVNTGDSPIGVFQQNLVAHDIQHHKTATRLVMVDVTDDRLLFGMLFHIHIGVPLQSGAEGMVCNKRAGNSELTHKMFFNSSRGF